MKHRNIHNRQVDIIFCRYNYFEVYSSNWQMKTGATMEYLSLLEAYVKEKVEIMTHKYAKTEAIFYEKN